MEVGEVMFSNAPAPIDVTLAGMVMEVSAVPLNAWNPIDVTLAGMVMEVSAAACLNAAAPIDVSVLPAAKVTEVSAVA
jgi:hypothetical protein